MSDSGKKQNFLHGAALLAIATAVVKLIGAFYKIPLQNTIGAAGYGYFTTAYNIYSILLLISTAGLPVAMSRMISQADSVGNYAQVRRVYSVSRAFFLGLGIVGTVVMMVFSRPLASLLRQPDAWFAIFCLGPCVLLMGFVSTYRGFFQGQGNMRPTSNSQMLEALFKLVVGLAAAFAIMRFTQDVSLAAGGAIMGVTVSCLVSAIYLRTKLGRAYRDLPTRGEAYSVGKTIWDLLVIAFPITVGSAGLQALSTVEAGLYMDRLVYLIGSNQYMGHLLGNGVDAQLAADQLKGIYDTAYTVFNMPCAFIVPITISIIPAITERLTLCQDTAVRDTEESAARITGLLSLPCAVGLAIMARPVMGLLFGFQGEELALAGNLLSILGISIFLYGIIQFTNALLQSHGYAYVPVINMLLCGGARLAVVYILVGNPNIGILGAPIGAAACYLCIAILNLVAARKCISQKPNLVKNLLRPILPAAIMGVVVYGAYHLLENILGAEGSRVLLCGVPIAVGAAVYFLCVVLFKSITKEDCQLLPKGETIAKILHL